MEALNDSTRSTERIFSRMRVMAGNAKSELLPDSVVVPTPGTEIFCHISDSRILSPAGFDHLISLSHKTATTVGSVAWNLVEKAGLPARAPGRAVCRKLGISEVVGGRVIYQSHPNLMEHYFAKPGVASIPEPQPMDAIYSNVVTVFGIGKLPIIGATLASAVTCAAVWPVAILLPIPALVPFLCVLAIASSVLCAKLEKWSQRAFFAEDPREVVLDEVAGMAVTLAIAGAGASVPAILVAFFAFRFFDIFKFGVHWIETTGWQGMIVWDDVLAGIYAGILTLGVLWLL